MYTNVYLLQNVNYWCIKFNNFPRKKLKWYGLRIGFKDCLTWAYFLDQPDLYVIPMHACIIESEAAQSILMLLTRINSTQEFIISPCSAESLKAIISPCLSKLVCVCLPIRIHAYVLKYLLLILMVEEKIRGLDNLVYVEERGSSFWHLHSRNQCMWPWLYTVWCTGCPQLSCSSSAFKRKGV